MQSVTDTEIPVRMKLYMEQIKNGESYKGFLEWEHGKLDFTVGFRIPIWKWDTDIGALPTDIGSIREVFPITFTAASGKQVPVSLDNMYAFFARAILDSAHSFYHCPATRLANTSKFPLQVSFNGSETNNLTSAPGVQAQMHVNWHMNQPFHDKLVSLFSFDNAKLRGNGGLAGFCLTCGDNQLKDICPICHHCIDTHCKHS